MTQIRNSSMDAAGFSMLCWNIKKGKKPNWREDLKNFASNKDLIILQEAILHNDLMDAFEPTIHCSFTKGYKSKKQTTGVMTFSKNEPLKRKDIISWEPWLATPKATNITEYSLAESDETLVVINLHAVNFTLGVRQYRKQIDKIRKVIDVHDGPMILSGDFNTWRRKRMKIIEALAQEHQLEAVSFSKDYRKSIFGQTLDHIYIRSLKTTHSETHQVKSSDHHPMTATLLY